MQDSPKHPLLPSSVAVVHSLLAALTSGSSEKKGLSPRQKDALLALHALLPAHVLDALDLLDRGLVTRLLLADAQGPPSLFVPDQSKDQQKQQRREYFVQSTRSLGSAWKGGRNGGQAAARATAATAAEGYHVRLRAWHCSCPGFAYAAFATAATLDAHDDEAAGRPDPSRLEAEQQGGRRTHTGQADEDDDDDYDKDEEDDSHYDTSWLFGGVTVNGAHSSSNRRQLPPVCKHLIACALADASDGTFDSVTDSNSDSDRNSGGGVRQQQVNTAELAAWAATGNGQG